jgi:dipeptidyl-peptidase-4
LKLSTVAFLLAACTAASAQAQSQAPPATGVTPWTPTEAIRAMYASFGPRDPVWSPDSNRLTYLAPNEDLLSVDPSNGKVTVLVDHTHLDSVMNPKINEKDKDHRSRYHTAEYHFSPDSRRILFDAGGELWDYTLATGTGVNIGSTGAGSGDDPKFAPTAAAVSYLKDHNIYVRNLSGGPELNLTNTHDPAVLNGEVDWVYEEELDVRSNYFWSPDSKNIAYLQANETKVPLYPIVDWNEVHATTDMQRYPQPGDPNPDVRIGIVSSGGGGTRWIKLPLSPGNDYIPRFGWVNDRTVWIETLLRDHKHIAIYFADVHSGNVRKVFAETADKFFDESYDLTFLDKSPEFLLTSWRDGHTHIYRYSYNAANPLSADAVLENEVESGNYEVSEIEGVNEAGQTIFYQSNDGNPLQQNVWAVKYDGSGKHKITTASGVNKGTFAPNGLSFALQSSDVVTPPSFSVCNAGGLCNSYAAVKPITNHTVRAPIQLTLKADDGTDLYAYLLLPEGATSPASVPLINEPYGGPHAQTVEDRFNPAIFVDQMFTEHGFAVLHVDNRGMGGRGRDFETVCYHNFGPIQLKDQLTALDQVLAKYPQLDAKRLGWWGWSWGGTFTLYAMTHSERFLAGIDGAPVTDWRNYDSIYTERYMGLPAEQAEIYKDFSVNNSAGNLHGHLLMIHGTGDDNVHLANTIQFIQQLVNKDIPYDLQLYPRKTHSLAGLEARQHYYARSLVHFETYLLNAK